MAKEVMQATPTAHLHALINFKIKTLYELDFHLHSSTFKTTKFSSACNSMVLRWPNYLYQFITGFLKRLYRSRSFNIKGKYFIVDYKATIWGINFENYQTSSLIESMSSHGYIYKQLFMLWPCIVGCLIASQIISQTASWWRVLFVFTWHESTWTRRHLPLGS